MERHIVFDFDCTLTAAHLYHTMHSGSVYLEQLKASISLNWDNRSMRVVTRILQSDAKWGADEGGEFGHIPGLLNEVPHFTNYIFGGPERIQKIRACLEYLRSTGAHLHISTKGIISDVIDMLRNARLIDVFSYIDGMDDTYESKRLYFVGKGFMTDLKTFYARDGDLSGLRNPSMFESKPAFIKHFLNSKSNEVIYLDDDQEYYQEVSSLSRVTTFDIGTKERYHTEGEVNLDSQTLDLLIRSVPQIPNTSRIPASELTTALARALIHRANTSKRTLSSTPPRLESSNPGRSIRTYPGPDRGRLQSEPTNLTPS